MAIKLHLQADHVRLNRFVDAAAMLKQGKRVRIDVPELAWFNSWHDVHEYCGTNDGSDIKPLVKLVDEIMVLIHSNGRYKNHPN